MEQSLNYGMNGNYSAVTISCYAKTTQSDSFASLLALPEVGPALVLVLQASRGESDKFLPNIKLTNTMSICFIIY